MLPAIMNEFFHVATSLVRIAKSKDTKNSEQSLAIKKKLAVGVQKSHSLPSFFLVILILPSASANMQDNLAVADVFLFYVADFEDIENAFGENNASECLVCERCVGVFYFE